MLSRNANEIARRAGRGIRISHAAARDYDPSRLPGVDKIKVTDDAFAVVNDPDHAAAVARCSDSIDIRIERCEGCITNSEIF